MDNAINISAATDFPEKQGTITTIGVKRELIDSLDRQLDGRLGWEPLSSVKRLSIEIEQGFLRGDAVLVGASIEEPIRVAQWVHRFDKTIPVLILSPQDRHVELQRAILFAPLLGNVVTPWSLDNIDNLSQAIDSAVERHRQRRHYLDTIPSVQPKIGNLSLSQPEMGHYLGRLLDHAPIGVVSLDSQSKILGINRCAEQILTSNEGDTLGAKLHSYFDEGSAEKLSILLTRCAVSQMFGMNPEVLQTSPAGSRVRFLEATVSRIAYRAENSGFMVILQDVTQRERTELQRKRTEDHMRQLSGALEQAADAVMITDSERIIEYVNPAFERLTGYSKEDVIGKETYFLRSGVQQEEFWARMWEKTSNGEVFRGVLINRRKDGAIYHEEKTITPLLNSDGEISHYISTGRDVTQRLDAEESIRRHQAESAHVARLSTLGEMASGIAHELNQPLCAITTYAQTCLRVLNSDDSDPQKLGYGLGQVIQQAEHASAIFQRLRNFSRKGEMSIRRVEFLEIISEVENLISAELAQRRIQMDISNIGSNPFVYADKVQIEQVLLNLIRNGMDAVDDLPANRKRLKLELNSNFPDAVRVSLYDFGQGVPAEVVEHVFEPFFTTKKEGLGVGLGISQAIIEAHGGKLYLESNSDSGACFSFELPLDEAALIETQAASLMPGKLP